MNWALVAGIAVLGVLMIGRTRLQAWIIGRWASGRLADLPTKVLLFAVMFGPILLGATWIAAVAGFPWSIVVLVVVLVSLVPAIGLANATFDDQARHVARLPPNGQDR
jgi:hypothetical protein